jgi:hypothetical protein
MKKYSIVGILSILVLVGCISLFQLTENLNEQIFSGVLQNITLKE